MSDINELPAETAKNIYDFAVKYHNLYSNPHTTEEELKSTFADECFSLGFKMDCGEGFKNTYHIDLNDAEELSNIIDSIADPYLLGSAVFSKWRDINYGCIKDGDVSLTAKDNRKWFAIAFSRLEAIAKEKLLFFKGTLKKFKLISNHRCYGLYLNTGDMIGQRISIDADEGVSLTTYRRGKGNNRLIINEKIPADRLVIKRILEAIERDFQTYDDIFINDAGEWYIELQNTYNEKFEVSGPMYVKTLPDLSDFIRELLKRNDLLLFDGNPDRVDKIEIVYDRHAEIKVKESFDLNSPYVICNYHEELNIDRGTETVEHFRRIAKECDIKNIYHIEEGVSDFLNGIDVDVFSEIEGNPSDVYVDPVKTLDYKLFVTTKVGGKREIKGTFDKKGLPVDWPEFIEELYDFLSSYGMGEIFDGRIYKKARRRAGDLIFCNVVFEEGGKRYCYLSDEDYNIGDLVVVPAGVNNRETVVRVVSVEYYPPMEAPFPLDKIKKIIGRVDEEDDEDF